MLLHLDELSASASHVMSTLSALCSRLPYTALATFRAASGAAGLADVVGRLWPFWRHPAAAARAAAIQTLGALLTAALLTAPTTSDAELMPPWLSSHLGPAVRFLPWPSFRWPSDGRSMTTWWPSLAIDGHPMTARAPSARRPDLRAEHSDHP